MPFTAGQKLRASELRPPMVSLRRNTAQSITNASWSNNLSWNSEVIDTDGAWAAGTPTQIIIPRSGNWGLRSVMRFESNATGIRGVRFVVDGVVPDGCELQFPTLAAGFRPSGTLSVFLPLTAGDIIIVNAYQNSGGALDTAVAVSHAPTFDAWFVRD